jgi:hypothetical protein
MNSRSFIPYRAALGILMSEPDARLVQEFNRGQKFISRPAATRFGRTSRVN